MLRTWEWSDLQFHYRLSADGGRLTYEKRLRWGGSIPGGPIDLAVAAARGRGALQEGEESAEVDLRNVREVRIERRPYRGYSAFRKPFVIIAGILCAIPYLMLREGWSGWDWLVLFAIFLPACFLVEAILARIFPHRMLVLEGAVAGAELDVHTLAEHERDDLVATLKNFRSTSDLS